MNGLIELQEYFMKLLGIDPVSGEKGALLNKGAILSAAIGLSVEASEVLDEMNKVSRPWKPKLDDAASFSLIAEEMTDVLFYFFELCVLLGLTGNDVKEMYYAKMNINLARIFETFPIEKREYAILNALGRCDGGNNSPSAVIANTMFACEGIRPSVGELEIYLLIHDPVLYMREKFKHAFRK